eukprot:CAMPEP_0114511820 /NCGR_PEP_ID=MMETSP0109-20121206/14621_1 /TAXON_ID=29199 /ORGANISM="Chlorarachnion reptans, Strain CCCM449" /LENGTH=116 /DNA_ID=CAMNT_0001691413 /DNA_START=152 /DNA_END=502 /DNA_ORIENTATION=+
MDNPRYTRSAGKARKKQDLQTAPVPRRQYVDMEEKKLAYAFDLAREGYMQRTRGELENWQDVAKKIKVGFDEHFEGSTKAWNCIVGNHFGSFVSFNTKDVAYFFIAEMGVMLWKHG